MMRLSSSCVLPISMCGHLCCVKPRFRLGGLLYKYSKPSATGLGHHTGIFSALLTLPRLLLRRTPLLSVVEVSLSSLTSSSSSAVFLLCALDRTEISVGILELAPSSRFASDLTRTESLAVCRCNCSATISSSRLRSASACGLHLRPFLPELSLSWPLPRSDLARFFSTRFFRRRYTSLMVF